ncbi:MAG: hypothetical protein LBQ45_01745, partial [Mycoplasmataceae bacterium]|nr:hypothetical protein [Mycoplasmataceae bacterium]
MDKRNIKTIRVLECEGVPELVGKVICYYIIKSGQTSEPPMTLRELNKKVDKIETTVSELAKIVTEFIVRQE